MKSFFISAVVCASMLGCSAGIEDLAEQNNWREIGYRDGIKGHMARTYKALKELGNADISLYEEGYQEGLEEYCDPDFAYQIGLSGQYYEGVCEGTEQAQKFRMEWQRGWKDAEGH